MLRVLSVLVAVSGFSCKNSSDPTTSEDLATAVSLSCQTVQGDRLLLCQDFSGQSDADIASLQSRCESSDDRRWVSESCPPENQLGTCSLSTYETGLSQDPGQIYYGPLFDIATAQGMCAGQGDSNFTPVGS
ncbi:hypothetical protein [Pseudobacteriovorax antillogorgiicola]|uniref:Uncharacterized protein n=1 Tax=Pseudobacteriovorax antillogorgiicola TaxID=1513793 RepID=A0A1Y6C6E1_9BACT|nr:hypothetical protein [Pseudobacteriovorax antillogorgiicola]TCS51239.1 hypothetical protein EDD56_111124 [Pseudobacteriovorax antillogorgiicola]SMF36787.1 hypothetical protein SAMN06296036_11154 [Pseudobacteriovorax antillogorgiicola]